MLNVLLIGAGAQAKYALESFDMRPDYAAAGVLTIGLEPIELPWLSDYGVPCFGSWESWNPAKNRIADEFLVCCADPDLKAEIFHRCLEFCLRAASAIHPRAAIASTATLGDGAIVNAGAVIQPFAEIGRGAMIHANAVVEHDCKLGDFVNLSPNVTLAGWVQIEDCVTVFTGANIIPEVRIGAGSKVGAGATVITDVKPGCTVVGIPARVVDA